MKEERPKLEKELEEDEEITAWLIPRGPPPPGTFLLVQCEMRGDKLTNLKFPLSL